MKIIKFYNEQIVWDARRIVNAGFPLGVAFYCGQTLNEWRSTIMWVQDEINEADLPRRMVRDMWHSIATLLGSDEIMIQRQAYLRAARPVHTTQESVGWHRESFYGCPPQALNFWVPLRGVAAENTLRYIPGSDLIPDEDILVWQEDDPEITRGSYGNKIGLLYAPKEIVSGVDLTKATPVEARFGEAAVFPSALIHGAAVNETTQIRFSLDMRIIAKEHVGTGDQREDFYVPL